MPMRYLRWLLNTGLSLLILSIWFSLSYAGDAASDRVGTLAGTIRDRYGSVDRLEQSVINPMISGDNPISCKSTNAFLEVSADPVSTGDIELQISLDSNMDKSFSLSSFTASGVCANGMVVCDPGTWNQCRSYMWQSSLENVSLVAAPADKLGGCYCINNSCGAGMFGQNTARILGDIGGGVVGAIQGKNPGLAITDAKVVGNKLVYFGQDNEQCRSGRTATALSALYENSSGLNQPLSVLSDSDESKKHSMLVTSMASNEYAERSCSMTQDYGIQTVTRSCNQEVPEGAIASQEDVQYMAIKTSSDYETNDCIFPQESFLPEGTPIVSSVPEDAISLGNRIVVTDCDKHRYWQDRAYFDNYEYYSLCRRTSDIKTRTYLDNCGTVDGVSGCRIKDETIDGVQVMQAYYDTQKPVPSTCRTYTGAVTSFTECSSEWHTERVYACQAPKKSYNFAEGRMESLMASTSMTGNTITYQDQRHGGSEIRAFQAPQQKQSLTCVAACKTKKSVTQTDAIPDEGHAGEYRTTSQREEVYYKTCTPTCPLSPGETIMKDCQCLNEFGEAAGIMSILNGAGEDLICSSGSRF